jgi:hypothetical protein
MQSPNIMFLITYRTMDNVQNCASYTSIDVPSSQTYRSKAGPIATKCGPSTFRANWY